VIVTGWSSTAGRRTSLRRACAGRRNRACRRRHRLGVTHHGNPETQPRTLASLKIVSTWVRIRRSVALGFVTGVARWLSFWLRLFSTSRLNRAANAYPRLRAQPYAPGCTGSLCSTCFGYSAAIARTRARRRSLGGRPTILRAHRNLAALETGPHDGHTRAPRRSSRLFSLADDAAGQIRPAHLFRRERSYGSDSTSPERAVPRLADPRPAWWWMTPGRLQQDLRRGVHRRRFGSYGQ
jgi:hypothetical protein